MKLSLFFLFAVVSFWLSYSLEKSFVEDKSKIIESYVIDVFPKQTYFSADDYITKHMDKLKVFGLTSISIKDNNNSLLISKSSNSDFSLFSHAKTINLKKDNLVINFSGRKIKIAYVEYRLKTEFSAFYIAEGLFFLVVFIALIIFKAFSFENNVFLKNDNIGNIKTINDFFKIENERFILIRDKAIELYFENEKDLLWKNEYLNAKNEKAKKDLSDVKNEWLSFDNNNNLCSKEINSLSHSITMLCNKLSEICNDKNQLGILNSIISNAKNMASIIKIEDILSEDSSVHQPSKLNLFDEINQIIEDNYNFSKENKVSLTYFPNNGLCEDCHGYGNSIGFILGYILKRIISLTASNSSIDIRTITLNRNNENYIRFKFNVTSGNDSISSNKESQFGLINAVSKKYSDKFMVSSVENSFDGTFDTEIVYETKCSILLLRKNQSASINKIRIAVYDKDISITSKIAYSLGVSGFKVTEMNSLQHILDFDLVFIEEYNSKRKDHLYLLNSKIKLCSIEKEIEHHLLNIKRSTTGLFGAISYASRIKDYKDIIRMAMFDNRKEIASLINDLTEGKEHIPVAIQNVLGKIKKKDSVLILSNDLDFKRSISSVFKASSLLSIVDIEINNFIDLSKIVEASPNVIIIDNKFNINGEKLNSKNFKKKLKFNHLTIGLCEDLNGIENPIYDKVINKKSDIIMDEVISLLSFTSEDLKYHANVVSIGNK